MKDGREDDLPDNVIKLQQAAIVASSVTQKFLSDLPCDLLDKSRRRLFLKVFVLAFLGTMFFFTLVLAIGAIDLWLSWQPVTVMVCILATVGGAAAVLLEADLKVPDLRLPLANIERDYKLRETLQIAFGISWLVLLGLGAVLWGWEGFIALMASICVGLCASSLYSVISSRVCLCSCCNRPARFRKFRGKWTCIMCGQLSETALLEGDR